MHPLFLRTSFSNQHAGIGLALWIKEHPVVPTTKPRWACIHADYAAGPDFCNGFVLVYKEIGEEIGRVPVPFKTLEKKSQLVQLSKLQPDFAFAFFAGATDRKCKRLLAPPPRQHIPSTPSSEHTPAPALPARPGQAPPDGGGEDRWGCHRGKALGRAAAERRGARPR